jgi:NAD(P)-dependent dehydrogenase (short-subunit alcohol dehydrogenase family)
MSIDLSGKVVLITGASTGIGRETALRFAAAGSLLALTYFEHRDEIEEVAELCRVGSSTRTSAPSRASWQ